MVQWLDELSSLGRRLRHSNRKHAVGVCAFQPVRSLTARMDGSLALQWLPSCQSTGRPASQTLCATTTNTTSSSKDIIPYCILFIVTKQWRDTKTPSRSRHFVHQAATVTIDLSPPSSHNQEKTIQKIQQSTIYHGKVSDYYTLALPFLSDALAGSHSGSRMLSLHLRCRTFFPEPAHPPTHPQIPLNGSKFWG